MKRHKEQDALTRITKDRQRTNILRKYEQPALAFLVRRIPAWINSDMLTAIGLAGGIIITAGFVMAACFHRSFLLLCILGFIINWFGDSLDGRLAYFRNKPRKWYGFALDLTADWLTTVFIGCGYIMYVGGEWELVGFGFVVLYGWAMMTALLRYRITGVYTIDSGLLGPTEVRIIISILLFLEILFQGFIIYSGVLVCAGLFAVNLIDSRKLLIIADRRDKDEQTDKIH
ncbi:MAG: CDP-alcohol phosphatidyltransferase [Bacteroidales bacterium]|nr:CDP-alcohol phosphatidyltransferase [Bacteroidales bacterium]